MKHLRLVLVCAALVLACMLTMVACGGDDTPAETTADTVAATEADTATDTKAEEADTVADTVADTTADEAATSAEDGTSAEEETGAAVAGDYFDFDPDTVVIISNAEELMAFNKAINEADPLVDYFWDETVLFTADIDMTGYEWTPLSGAIMDNVTFDGQGHTISNLTFKTHETPFEPGAAPADAALHIGSGFVDIVNASMTFKGLTLDNCSVVAHERAVGNFIGLVVGTGGAVITFEDCKSSNFTVDGWMDIDNTNAEEKITICQRASGFIGHIMAGATAKFTNCVVEDITMSAYQNMAGFVGYDATGTIDEYSFTNCSVSGAEFTFAYGMRLTEDTVETKEKKYVAVFFNGADWVDKTDACVAMGNTYDSVSYYDWANDNKEYTPADFRSWAGEETPAA